MGQPCRRRCRIDKIAWNGSVRRPHESRCLPRSKNNDGKHNSPTHRSSLTCYKDHILRPALQAHRLLPWHDRLARLPSIRRKRRQPPHPHLHRPTQHPLARKHPHQNRLPRLPRARSSLRPRARPARRLKPPAMVSHAAPRVALPHYRHRQRARRGPRDGR